MALPEEFEEALNRCFNWHLTNVSELEGRVLIVLEYSPQDDQRPISIAFDYSGGPKCWLSEPQVKMLKVDGEDIGPARNETYRQFVFEERVFYPYSIQAFPQSIFENFQEFVVACRSLYQHVE